jgi:4-amino-4-deoxy-L-arabinose transferase-like glycosyltransferase
VGAVVLAAALRLWPASRPTGNLFYDAAVRSMGLSWRNFFFGAIEPAGSVSVDKPPGDLWLQVASTKVLGFTTFALHLPEAVAGTAAVGMLYCVVRSVWGPLAGGLAAFALAVLPVSVLTSRSDTMDSVTMALLVAALWASIRALETRRSTWILAAAGLVGVAFNVKLAQALIPLPGFALMWWAAARRRARIPILLGAAAVLVVVSMSWITIASLTPARERPYPVGSGNGSIYRVVFLFNGLDRIRGSSPQVGSSDPTAPGPLRLVSAAADYNQLIGVELAAAVALLLAAGLVGRIRPGRAARLAADERDSALDGDDRDAGDAELEEGLRVARWTAAGLGIWLVTAVGLLSGIRQLQTRYLETASPAVAGVLGVCAAGLIVRTARGERREPRWALAAALRVSGLYGIASATDGVGRVAGGLGVVGGLLLAWWPWGSRSTTARRRGPGIACACAIVGLGVLALPLWVSVDVIGRGLNDATHGGSGAQYAGFLRAHRGGARYEAASGDTLGVVGLIASDAQPVLILEDVKGPLVRLARLERLVRRGAVRYVLIDHPCTSGRRCPSAISWSMRHTVRVRGYLFAYTASSRASPGSGGGAS